MKKNLLRSDNFCWEGITKIEYKAASEGESATFSNVIRQNLFFGDETAGFDIRYFECAADGYTSLEKHEHAHVVVVLRGNGLIINGEEYLEVKPFDMVRIPSWNAHQLINKGEEPFGFLCAVNKNRDPFQLLTEDEFNRIIKNPVIKKYVRIPQGYFLEERHEIC